jgi:CubicO group peptidase (beta-lactamase class C family)
MSMHLQGFVAPGFERVREVFAENFSRRGEVGASFVVRRRGQVVVDLWGGTACPATGRAWTRDTPVVVFSVTKGLVAMVALMLTEEGVLDPDERVSHYWPEFAGQGRDAITVRTLLSHRSGLAAIDTPLTLADFADRQRVHQALVAQAPLWEPGTLQGYHACSYGPYVGELLFRATGKSAGQLFAEKIARPLGLQAWLGTEPARWEQMARLVPLTRMQRLRYVVPRALCGWDLESRVFRSVMLARSWGGRAFRNPDMGPTLFHALNDPAVLQHELAWIGAVANADSLSRAYGALIGEVDGVRLVKPETVEPLLQRQSWQDKDAIMQKPLGWSQGFLKEDVGVFSPNPRSFGHPGAGGSLGWADPDAGLSIGYTMNRMDWRIRSPRALALCDAVYQCL